MIRTTTARTYNDLRIQSMKDFDSVLATMSSHPASRPACAPIQGKIVNIVPRESSRYDPEYPSIYDHGYGKPSGCFGINCGHKLYPYIKGVSHNSTILKKRSKSKRSNKSNDTMREISDV